MQAGTGWDVSDTQLAFTLFILCQTWVQPLDGGLIDRLGPRGFISAAGLLCGLRLLAWAFAQAVLSAVWDVEAPHVAPPAEPAQREPLPDIQV